MYKFNINRLYADFYKKSVMTGHVIFPDFQSRIFKIS